jgi:hypothetical protein
MSIDPVTAAITIVEGGKLVFKIVDNHKKEMAIIELKNNTR